MLSQSHSSKMLTKKHNGIVYNNKYKPLQYLLRRNLSNDNMLGKEDEEKRVQLISKSKKCTSVDPVYSNLSNHFKQDLDNDT